MKLSPHLWKMKSPWRHQHSRFLFTSLIMIWLVGCATPKRIEGTFLKSPTYLPSSISSPQPVEPTSSISLGLSGEQIATLNSLQKIDDYPLYTMHYAGSYPQIDMPSAVNNFKLSWKYENSSQMSPEWECSIFVAFADASNIYFGRNFDWEFSPALLLYNNPPDGYASVSIVDIAYLGFNENQVMSLLDLPLDDRKPLLRSPTIPFDGMNERGLAIGMAAVPNGELIHDPKKETISSLQIMRQILDKAASVGEAIAILSRYNIEFEPGPALHYLMADSSGEAVLVEFHGDQMHLIYNENPWHLATNFLVSKVDESQGYCTRYDIISDEMLETGGSLTPASALELLAKVSQINTQWSVLYHMGSGKIDVVVGNNFNQPYQFQLNP